jgi:hypothetical protein
MNYSVLKERFVYLDYHLNPFRFACQGLFYSSHLPRRAATFQINLYLDYRLTKRLEPVKNTKLNNIRYLEKPPSMISGTYKKKA